jgi:hypothetical protein
MVRSAVIGLIVLLLLTACTPGAETPPGSPSPGAASPGPVASPRPALRPGQVVYIANTDRLGADFRQAPGSAGARIRVLPEGAVLEATGRDQQADDWTWDELRDSTGIVGWVQADYLSTTPPPLATPTAMPFMGTSTPVPTLVPIPVPTQATAGPRPTDTLVPIGPGRQQPGLAPLPPGPTPKPAAPTLLPPAPIRPTNDAVDGDTDRIRCPDGTFVEPNRPGGCPRSSGPAR